MEIKLVSFDKQSISLPITLFQDFSPFLADAASCGNDLCDDGVVSIQTWNHVQTLNRLQIYLQGFREGKRKLLLPTYKSLDHLAKIDPFSKRFLDDLVTPRDLSQSALQPLCDWIKCLHHLDLQAPLAFALAYLTAFLRSNILLSLCETSSELKRTAQKK
jgi:hypothetical protein